MFELMYACGLRVSEAVSLRTRDVDFADNILHIHGKGDKERLVPFYDLAKELLVSYIKDVRDVWANSDETALFVKQRGKKPVSYTHLAFAVGVSSMDFILCRKAGALFASKLCGNRKSYAYTTKYSYYTASC